ncbi:hypothetical protein [Rhodococcus opacus]|uniref:Uncharacterized protein n=1 Tax=Rhodococcus opacus (strain B4) TaxID=632772 RepID=C1ASH2_RHOOB|nr:hypothetical protein [Rhodococcus opacus]BAH48421.1 hypothetical protein ROP_01740 [Rhodococcus opacus B4]
MTSIQPAGSGGGGVSGGPRSGSLADVIDKVAVAGICHFRRSLRDLDTVASADAGLSRSPSQHRLARRAS